MNARRSGPAEGQRLCARGRHCMAHLLPPCTTLLLLLACGTGTQPASSNSGGVIPWIDRQGIPSSLANSVHAGRPCTAADLTIVVGGTGAFQGKATQELEFRNHAGDACFLASVPRTQLSDVSTQRQVGSDPFSTKRVDLAPGQSAQLIIGGPAGCAASANPRLSKQLTFTLPHGDVMAADGTRVNTECGPAEVVAFNAIDIPTAPPGPLSNLKLKISLQQRAARGSELNYQITIQNPTATAIDYAPCPSYTQGISTTSATATQQTLLLNCAAVTRIDASASLVYQMKLQVPSSMPLGPAKVYWHLEVPGGASAGAPITIN